MENELHTIAIGQSTHQDLVQKSGSQRICMLILSAAHIFPCRIWPAAHVFHKESLS